MPELPEVEALARSLDRRLTGRTVEALRVFGIATLKTVQPRPGDLAGATVDAVGRRGKFLLIAARHYVAVHLARAGWVRWHDQAPATLPPRRSPVAARLLLDDGSGVDFTEAGTEKRLALYVAVHPEDVPGIARLGIDALDPGLDTARLGPLLVAAGRAHLKTVLADQSVIAGIGNAYSDEILHVARLSPFQPASSLGDEAVARLAATIHEVLDAAVTAAVATDPAGLKDAKRAGMRVHGRTGQPCPVCGDTVRQVDLGSRSLQYCPTCQTGGRVYADRRLSRLLR